MRVVQASVRFLTVDVIDLFQRAVALAGVITGVGQPGLPERLQDLRGIEPFALRREQNRQQRQGRDA